MPLVRVVGLVCLVACAMLAMPPRSALAQNSTDYCRYSTRSTLFLIDRTTPYDANDHRVIAESIGAVVDHLETGDRLVVATIGAHYSDSARAFNGCVPGCPVSGNFFTDTLGECRAVIAQRDRRLFRARLLAAVRPLTNNPDEQPFSDITGTVAQATQHPMGGRGYSRLYLFSDMLENSQALPWRAFRSQPVEASMAIVTQNSLVPAVRGVDVHIAGYGRLHDPGRPFLPAELDRNVRGFWRAYFAAGGAGAVEFEAAFTG